MCKKNNVSSLIATFGNINKVCKIGTFQRNISTILVKILNIYLFQKYFKKLKL